MVIDTSAIIAILSNEPEQQNFIEAIERSESRLISSATYLETSIVLLHRFGEEGLRNFDLFMMKAEFSIEPVDVKQVYIARRAYQEFGKNRHPANLNFGDCFAYALSKLMGQPLLFKGSDFSETDIVAYLAA